MLEQNFSKIYNKFKLLLYTRILKNHEESKEALSSLEVICMEIIVALGAPTIAEFSKFARMSAPNAAYRVNKLVTKGYVERVQSTVDKREYHLRPTEKYSRDYGDIFNYIDVVSARIRKSFGPEDSERLSGMLSVIADELMPEIDNIRDFE